MASGHDFMVEVLFLAGLAGGETGLPGISRMDSGPRPPWAFPRIRSRSRGSAKVFLALTNLHRGVRSEKVVTRKTLAARGFERNRRSRDTTRNRLASSAVLRQVGQLEAERRNEVVDGLAECLLLSRRNSSGPFGFGRFRLCSSEPRVGGSNPAGRAGVTAIFPSRSTSRGSARRDSTPATRQQRVPWPGRHCCGGRRGHRPIEGAPSYSGAGLPPGWPSFQAGSRSDKKCRKGSPLRRRSQVCVQRRLRLSCAFGTRLVPSRATRASSVRT